MMGVVEDKAHITGLGFESEGDLIYLVGRPRNDINCSEYLYSYHKVKLSPAPYFDLEEEYELQQSIKGLIREGLIESAHDVADGGLFITLFESARVSKLGFSIDSDPDYRKDAFLFGESQSRVVVSVKPENEGEFAAFLAQTNTEFSLLGEVIGTDAIIDNESFGSIEELDELFESVIPKMMA
jgi:phosphoribosylformylglycinamidine synthase